MYEFTGRITGFEDNVLMYESHIPIPDAIFIEMKKIAPDKRIKCIINNAVEHYCAMSPKKDSYHYILLNKDILKKIKLALNDTVEVRIEKQELKYGIPICKELEEVLNTDWEGSDYFHKLTSGAQRSLIHLINKYKNPQLRIERSIILLRHLVQRQGNLDFKILQQNFKDGL